MKKILFMVLALSLAGSLSAQTSAKYEQRYDLLVSQFGPAGIGVETVLDNWAKVDSTNAKMLQGRFTYLYTKAQSEVVESRPGKKYLGMEPVLTLKDSLGNDVNYFQTIAFDEEIYADALKAADKAISVYPDKLEFRFMKANAHIAYEKESPDMALAGLIALVDENYRRKSSWEYDGAKADQEFFQNAMQEYCYSFYAIGSPAAYEAFKSLSEKMSVLFPDNPEFLNNIGTYYLVKGDFKTAHKYYGKVLKSNPDDYTAIQNGLLAARKQKNKKLEKKYQQALVRLQSNG